MTDDKKAQELTPKQKRMIALILGAPTVSEGCEKAGVSRTWFYKSMRDSAFKDEFVRQRQEFVDSALHELKITASEAVKVLRDLLKAESEGVRLRTALGILEHIGQFVTQENVEARLSALEKEMKR